MKKPQGYGGIIKLKGRRRQPYAVRRSYITQIITVSVPDDQEENFKKAGFKKGKNGWSAENTDQVKSFVTSSGLPYDISFRQVFKYLGYFASQADANKFLAEINAGSIIQEHKRYTDSPTFSEMFEKWMEYRQSMKNKLSKSSVMSYYYAYKHFDSIHSRKFSTILAEDFQKIMNENNSKKKACVGRIRTIIKGVCKYAVMNHYVDKDPSAYLVTEWTEPEKEIHKPFTDEEIKFLWEHVDIPNADLILIYIYTGMRPIELLQITTDNIHLNEKYLIGGCKTESGKNRIIPISDKILPLIKNRYNHNEKYLVLSKTRKKYTYQNYVKNCFYPLMSSLQWDHKPHDGRHTFATLMDRAGANEICTKLIMGHSINDITKGVYTHKNLNDLLREVNKI